MVYGRLLCDFGLFYKFCFWTLLDVLIVHEVDGVEHDTWLRTMTSRLQDSRGFLDTKSHAHMIGRKSH